MTVIAFDGKTIAADKQATGSSTKYTVTKLYKHRNTIFALSGTICYVS